MSRLVYALAVPLSCRLAIPDSLIPSPTLLQTFHTVFLEGVPAMDMQVRDQARRFITLVDELYNHRVRLVCSAADAPDALFAGADHSEPIIDLESLQVGAGDLHRGWVCFG